MITAPTFLLVLALGLCALIFYDVTKSVRTGVARGRTGTIRRATRPEALFFCQTLADLDATLIPIETKAASGFDCSFFGDALATGIVAKFDDALEMLLGRETFLWSLSAPGQ
jgi:hypothetical protein